MPKSICFIVVILACRSAAVGDLITLENGTATYSQRDEDGFGPYSPDEAVDGIGGLNPPSGNGWAIATFGNPLPNDTLALEETAVWETAFDVESRSLQFELDMINMLGHFRLSVTSDDRATFADGLDIDGDVFANWVALTNATITGPAGMAFLTDFDNGSILVDVSQPFPVGGTYSILFDNPLQTVTGIRLEALEHPSLPHGGPGLTPQNGNFLLVDMRVTAVPEPSTFALMGLGMTGFGFVQYRRRRGRQ